MCLRIEGLSDGVESDGNIIVIASTGNLALLVHAVAKLMFH
jgi:hypothetical protein